VSERLRVYLQQTQVLVDYYRQRGLLLEVDGSLQPEVVTDRMLRARGPGGGMKRYPASLAGAFAPGARWQRGVVLKSEPGAPADARGCRVNALALVAAAQQVRPGCAPPIWTRRGGRAGPARRQGSLPRYGGPIPLSGGDDDQRQ